MFLIRRVDEEALAAALSSAKRELTVQAPASAPAVRRAV